MAPAEFHDHFSRHAGAYAAHRPRYPEALWEWVAEQAPGRERCWDVGTGNGQAAVALARHFGEVFASDGSAEQIGQATPAPGVRYAVERAEASSLGAGSVDAVVIAQALHWLEFGAFFAEVRRVLRPGGVLLACCYELLDVDDGGPIDRAVRAFYVGDIAPFWPPQRRHIERGYADIAFPFEPLAAPAVAMTALWDRRALLDYLGTWSAVRRYQTQTGRDPLPELARDLAAVWPEAESRPIRFPLTVRASRAP